MKKLLTLCIVVKDTEILLGLKKRGFGEGRWNGFGGKLDEGETIEIAATRELKEETGLEADMMTKLGILEFTFEKDPKILEVHVFKVNNFKGIPVESEEMKPEWFAFDDIPYEHMWSADQFWLPYVLQDISFRGKVLFDRPSDATYAAQVIRKEFTVLDHLE